MIAFDRYNVIVKGLSAKPLTSGGAVLRIAGIWGNALVWTLLPMFGWNRYVPEGYVAHQQQKIYKKNSIFLSPFCLFLAT